MGRIEAILSESVWTIAHHYAGLWDQKTALSAGIAALNLLDAEGREKALAIAKDKPPTPLSNKETPEDLGAFLGTLAEMLENNGDSIKLLDEQGQAGFDHLRKLLGPESNSTEGKLQKVVELLESLPDKDYDSFIAGLATGADASVARDKGRKGNGSPNGAKAG